MRKLLIGFLEALIILPVARAGPPPADSSEARELGQFRQTQNGPLGLCCKLGDSRIVDVRIYGGHYEVKFLPRDHHH